MAGPVSSPISSLSRQGALVAKVILVLVLITLGGHVTRADEGKKEDRRYLRLCMDGIYNLLCDRNQSVSIVKAWYGRLAHDRFTCSHDNAVPSFQPDLLKDCGSDVMESLNSWCPKSERRGCTITVKDLDDAKEDVVCEPTVSKYLYLEYTCVRNSATRMAAPVANWAAAVLTVVVSLLLFKW